MEKKYIQPFTDSISAVLGQFGMQNITPGAVREEESTITTSGLIAMIGIVGPPRGNIAFSMSQETAKSLASAMMMGMPVETLGSMEISALSELCNMFVGNAAFDGGKALEITPPSVVTGNDMFVVMGSENSFAQDVETDIGRIAIKICLEI